MKKVLLILSIPATLLLVMILFTFSNTNVGDVNEYTVSNNVTVYDTLDKNILDRLVKYQVADTKLAALNPQPVTNNDSGINAAAAIKDDAQLTALATAYNARVDEVAAGQGKPSICKGLGQYMCAKAKENNISPFMLMSIGFQESTHGTIGPQTIPYNNFCGMGYDGKGTYQHFNKPEDCVDALVATLVGYRDKSSYGNLNVFSIGAIVKTYVGVGGGDFNQWVSSIHGEAQLLSKRSGVALDITE